MTPSPKAFTVGFLAITLLAGCSILPQRSAKQAFQLPAPALEASERKPLSLTLRVLSPHSEPPLSGTRILVNPERDTVKAYNGARWANATPLLVRDHLIEGLRQTGELIAVVNETSAAASDLSLSSDLTLFQLQYPEDKPTVVIQLDAQLLASESGEVVAAKRFRIDQSVEDKPVGILINGFGSASEALIREMANWVSDISRGFSQGKDPATPL